MSNIAYKDYDAQQVFDNKYKVEKRKSYNVITKVLKLNYNRGFNTNEALTHVLLRKHLHMLNGLREGLTFNAL